MSINNIVVGSIRTILVICLAITLLVSCTSLEKKDLLPVYIEVPSEKYEIPDGYKSYTLFFATSYKYTENLDRQQLAKLKKQIKQFGKGIGDNNLAIWVKNPDYDSLNVELGKTYCDRIYKWHKLALDYTDGPYLLYMTHHPDSQPKEKDFAVAISFSNANPEQIAETLEYLEATIRRGNVSKYATTVINYWLDLKYFLAEKKEPSIKFIREIFILGFNKVLTKNNAKEDKLLHLEL